MREPTLALMLMAMMLAATPTPRSAAPVTLLVPAAAAERLIGAPHGGYIVSLTDRPEHGVQPAETMRALDDVASAPKAGGAPLTVAAPYDLPSAASPQPAALAVSVTGYSTWYAAPPGQAAAGPALRRALGPDWRGTRVVVSHGGRSVTVTLSDWMRADRLIDLDDGAFARLAPLSVGVIRVEIRVASAIALPATDTQP